MDRLQRAGPHFLMRLVEKHGPRGAARVLRALADELEGVGEARSTSQLDAECARLDDANGGEARN